MTEKKYTKSCPKCGRFIEYCWCDKPIEERLPNDEEIRKYLNVEILGFRAKDEFVSGFRAGWAALKDHLPEFKKANPQSKSKVSVQSHDSQLPPKGANLSTCGVDQNKE